MPLSIDTRTAADPNANRGPHSASHTDTLAAAPSVRVGLVNNMPDSALEATERQFATLLNEAAGTLQVQLRLFALPEIERGAAARERIGSHYYGLQDLWQTDLDALIVTGAEPRTPDLSQENYWQSLTRIIDWAKSHVCSSIWSCLAAHAAVLYLDDVVRAPLTQKCCGVYTHRVNDAHVLLRGLTLPMPAPHSRWNELRSGDLQRRGYDILTESDLAGVNLFAKQIGSLFLFWQGHPEYEERSLLKEYQRDVARYLRSEREAYPNMPYGYFSAAIEQQFGAFQKQALARRDPALIGAFPFDAAAAELSNSWRAAAIETYGRWLQWIVECKSARSYRRA